VTARPVLSVAALAVFMAAAQARAVTPLAIAPAPPDSRWREASLDEYRQHLLALTTLVEACTAARDAKSCDPTQVGPDDRVPSPNADRRLIRYGWLRVLLAKAEEKDEPAPKPEANAQPASQDAPPPPPTTTELLQAANARLAADLAQTTSPPAAAPSHTEQRFAMTAVLAGRDFRNLEEPTARDAALERLNNWLNWIFQGASKLRARSKWVGRLVVASFILAICVALVWSLIRLERRWRVRLVPDETLAAPNSAAARDWQLWLNDARRAAATGAWRNAIHCAYWASISRLEARRLWPADRARTPREYLALLSSDDPRRPGLATLTRSFERTWYGARPAAEADYRRAEELAAALISSASARSGGAE